MIARRTLSGAVTAVLVIAACGEGGGDDVATADPPSTTATTMTTTVAPLDALAFCEQHRPPGARDLPAALGAEMTAGFVTELYRSAGADPGIWADMEPAHRVVDCGYGDPSHMDPEAPVTTIVCEDGTTHAAPAPSLPRFLVDGEGNVAPYDISPDATPAGGLPRPPLDPCS